MIRGREEGGKTQVVSISLTRTIVKIRRVRCISSEVQNRLDLVSSSTSCLPSFILCERYELRPTRLWIEKKIYKNKEQAAASLSILSVCLHACLLLPS